MRIFSTRSRSESWSPNNNKFDWSLDQVSVGRGAFKEFDPPARHSGPLPLKEPPFGTVSPDSVLADQRLKSCFGRQYFLDLEGGYKLNGGGGISALLILLEIY